MRKQSLLPIMLGGLAIALGLIGYWWFNAQNATARSPQPNPPENNVVAQNPTDVGEPVDPQLVAANTRFGFKLFGQLAQQNGTENLLISPSSVAIALAMTYNGASGTTQQAMAETLELQGMSLEAINQANAALKASLEQADPTVKLAIANSLWSRADISFQPDFLQRNQEFYQAEVESLDFSNPDTPDRINTWVSEQTEGKIPQIIETISPDEILFLVNAIYFKGNWTEAFNRNATVDRPFTLVDGTQKQHPLMTQRGHYSYLETEQFQAISLPYGNGRLSMYVFLPQENSNLTTFYQTLTAENWETWMRQFSSEQGMVQLPRFKSEYSTQLNEALEALGMEPAFDAAQADFSGMTDVSAVINRVQHKTFIEVNETGTEAAAATSVGIATVSAPANPPFEMVVDRPFFYAIRDNQTGTVLFMGSVVNPAS
jgi:serine protease inhibitor